MQTISRETKQQKHPLMKHSTSADTISATKATRTTKADTLTCLTLEAEQRKEVVVDFTGGDLTSDGGYVPITIADRALELTANMATALGDKRQTGKVEHSLETCLRSRVGAIAMEYIDCNDLNTQRKNPGLAIFAAQHPLSGDLPGQSTVSRLENKYSLDELYGMAQALAKCAVARLPRDAKLVCLDVDGTDLEGHGQQQCLNFVKHYGHTCHLPLLVHVNVPGGRRWTVTAMLRPGNYGNSKGFRFVVSKALKLVRLRCPQAQIMVRADAGFGTWKIVRFLERNGVKYVLGWRSSPALETVTAHVAQAAQLKYNRFEKCYLPDRWLDEQSRQKRADLKARRGDVPRSLKRRTECVAYGRDAHMRAKHGESRWIITKATVTPSVCGDSSTVRRHYLLTNLSPLESERLHGVQWARQIHPFYCLRGDQENRIKEWKLDMRSGRISCQSFAANQFRLLLHTAALLLLNVLQENLPATKQFQNLQVNTLRMHFLKVAARISVSCRRIHIQLPTSYPFKDLWLGLNRNLMQLAPPET